MSMRTMTAETQDPEEVFELPECYRDASVLDREPRPQAADMVFDDYLEKLERGGRRGAIYESRIASVVGGSQPLPVPASVLDGIDCDDPATLTPLQAAVVEVAMGTERISATMSVTDLWGRVRGLAFAFEAFVEYCHLMRIDDQSFLSPLPWAMHGEPRPDVVRLLDLMRSAPERDRAEALAVATRLRQNEPSAVTQALTTLLFPERPEWFWADLSAAEKGLLAPTALLPSVTTIDQASALAAYFQKLPEWEWNGNPAVERAFVAAAGAEALPFLLAWCDAGHRCPPPAEGRSRRCPIHARCFEAIARIPTDAAMRALVERFERDAAYENLYASVLRFPHRAMRILAESEPSEETTRLLAVTVLGDPGRARTVAGRLNPEASARIQALLVDEQPAAAPVDLPELLTAPPWQDKKRKRRKPTVVEGLTPPADVKVVWQPGEREAWLALHGAGWVPENGWEAALTQLREVGGGDLLATYVAAYGPEELVRPALETWQPPLRMLNNRAQTFVAKYELLALPTVLAMNRFPAVRAQLLQPFVSAEIAAIMADGLSRLRSMRGYAAAWLRRHPEDAVRCLVPTAVGKPGKTRQNTVAALRLLEGDGVDVAGIGQQAYGGDVGIAIKEVLADTGLDVYPRTLPEAPLWARAALLPEIRWKDGRTPLPRSAAQAVAEMLMFSKPDAPYPGLEIVKEVCDASSLADFAWSLFESWEHAGAPKEDSWAFGGLGLLGDDTTVTRLQKLIRDWRAERKYPKAIDGFDALGAIGGDRALTALHTFANLSWPQTLKRKAGAKFDDVAHSMDLTAEQLADHTVPTLGFSAEGTLDLDYGTRRFTVSIDELLRLVVRDENGSVLRAFPKPGKRDDPELAPAAYRRFTQLKKETQHVTQEQIGRLEQAMVDRRRWSLEDFRAALVPHLLLGRIVRRLVWGVYAEDGELLGSFRVAEDFSFADIDDAHYEVPDGGLIGVAHPVDLARTLGPWSEVFADYEILQPFDQLGRPPLELSDEDRAGKCLVRSFIHPDASAGTSGIGQVRTAPAWFGQLVSRGWQAGPIGPDRLWSRLLRPVGGGRHVVMEIVPGLEAGAVAQSDYQAIKAVWLSATGGDPEFETDALPLSELDRVSASAVLRDLER